MRRTALIALLSGLICVTTGCAHSTLKDAIQSQWNQSVTLKLVDNNHDTVIFEDDNQYVFNTFLKHNGKYTYSKSGEEGWTFHGPFIARPQVIDKNQDVVWGVIHTKQKLGRVDVILTQRSSPNTKIPIHAYVQSNTFVAYPSVLLYDSEPDAMRYWVIHVNAYNTKGNEIVSQDYD